MNFQAVTVGQKLIEKNVGTGGYTDAFGTPTAQLLNEIEFVDTAIGSMVSKLSKQNLTSSTLIVITAKHGQSPIDPKRFFPIPGQSTSLLSPAALLEDLLPASESRSNPNGIGPTEDDISLLWLADSANTAMAVSRLEANETASGIGEIFAGNSVLSKFQAPGLPPTGDPRTPDIIVQPNVGVVYTSSSKKLAEHGGFANDDTNVMLLLSNPELKPQSLISPVETKQIAPTILRILGLKPAFLDAQKSRARRHSPECSSSINPQVPFRLGRRNSRPSPFTTCCAGPPYLAFSLGVHAHPECNQTHTSARTVLQNKANRPPGQIATGGHIRLNGGG